MTAPETCARPGCRKPPETDKFCNKDYRYRLRHQGIGGHRDAARAAARVRALRDDYHWTWKQIGVAAGTSHTVARNIYTGKSAQVLERTERAILAVPLDWAPESDRVIPSVGTRRRMQAMAWMGWPARLVAERIGYRPHTLLTVVYRDRVSVRVAHRIRAIYPELANQRGPSRNAAVKARSRGNAPPAAWDGTDMDDPKARPRGVRREAA